MPQKRITIIPPLHGKITRDDKMSEPDIYWILEKWLERHPEVKAVSETFRLLAANGLWPPASRPGLLMSRLWLVTTSQDMIRPRMQTCTSITWLRNGTGRTPDDLPTSQKLATKIKAGTLATVPLDENLFADWSASLFVADRTQYIILSNTKSLYSTVLCGKGITDYNYFIDRALSSLREFMEADGQEFVYRRLIAPASGTVRFAKALDRSVTGSMNDLIRQATYWLAQGELSPFDVGFRLNDVLMSALAPGNSISYGRPRDAFKALANSMET